MLLFIFCSCTLFLWMFNCIFRENFCPLNASKPPFIFAGSNFHSTIIANYQMIIYKIQPETASVNPKSSVAGHIFIKNTQLSHKISETLVFHFFQRKKIGFGKSDFVRFCFAKSKTRVRNAPRHQWKCVQNALSRPADPLVVLMG